MLEKLLKLLEENNLDVVEFGEDFASVPQEIREAMGDKIPPPRCFACISFDIEKLKPSNTSPVISLFANVASLIIEKFGTEVFSIESYKKDEKTVIVTVKEKDLAR
jgi:hypothetical protein